MLVAACREDSGVRGGVSHGVSGRNEAAALFARPGRAQAPLPPAPRQAGCDRGEASGWILMAEVSGCRSGDGQLAIGATIAT